MRQPDSCISELPNGGKIVAGHAADHLLIQQLLLQTLQVPLEEDFQSRLDDPAYQPCDRLLARFDDLITSHVHVSHHVGMFHGERIPLVWLENFVALPEYAQLGHDEALLRAAESTAAHEGAILALTVTDRPDWFQRRGWSALLSQGHTRADVRSVLAHLDAHAATRRRRRRPQLEIRAWRHFELDAVRDLYEQIIKDMWGPLCRSERCWQWLIGRKAHDQILLAVEVRSPAAEAASQRVVGYAIVRDSCVIEMFTLPGYSIARTMLLARACRDAIDRDHHFLSLHTPADDSLHELVVTSGGAWMSDGANGGERWMVKLLSPERWTGRLYPLLHAHARAAGVSRPFQLTLVADGNAYELTLTRRSARLEVGKQSADRQLTCHWSEFQNLLLGNRTRLGPTVPGDSEDSTSARLRALLPPQLFWQSPFELIRL